MTKLHLPDRKLFWSLIPSGVIPVAIALLLNAYFQDVSWAHEPFHALLESVGALAAIMAGIFILLLQQSQQLDARYIWVATALMSMGLLDGFHAATHPGECFIWLHSLANFIGGVCFAMLLLPERLAQHRAINALPYTASAISIVIALISIIYADRLPQMLEQGEFTLTAKALNIIGGIGFILAWISFNFGKIQDYRNARLFLANHTLLFGTAGLLFEFSMLWDATWWLWHLLRLFAYLVVLWYFIQQYFKLSVDSKYNEARFRSLVESTSDWIWEIDENDRFTYVSPTIQALLGYQPEELIGKSAFHLMDKTEAQKVDKVYRDLIENHQPFKGMININRHKDGHEVILESSGVPLFDDKGKWCGYRGIDRDITQRKQVDKYIRDQSRLLDKIFQHIPSSMVLLDRDYNFIQVSDSYASACQRDVDDFPGHNHFEFYPSDLQQEIEPFRREKKIYQRSARPFIFPGHPENSTTYWDLNLVPILDDDNEIEMFLFTLKDVSDFINTHDRLQNQLKFDETIIQSSPIGIAIYDTSGQCLEVNSAVATMIGTTRQQILTQNYNDLASWRKSGLLDAAQNALETQQKTRHDYEVTTTFGKHAFFDCLLVPFQQNEQQHLLLMIDDITERETSKNNLIQIEQRLNEAQRLAKIGSWELDLVENYLWWSNENFKMFGFKVGEFGASYEAFLEAVHPDDRDMVNQAYTESVKNKTPYSINHRLIMQDGSVKYVNEQCETLYDDAGQPVLSRGTAQDVTDRVLSEKALLKSERRFRATFEQAAVGVAHVSLDGYWLQVNQKLCDIVDYPREELIQLSFEDITQHEDVGIDDKLRDELLAGKRNQYQVEKRYLRKDGSIIWINLTASLVLKNDGKPDYIIQVIEDISLRKQAEQKILNNLHEKECLLRELHHRVKNNMQVISSMLNLQSRYSTKDSLDDAFQQSRQRIRAMSLIHERLYASEDLSKIEFNEYLHYLSERLERLYHDPSCPINIQVSGESLPLSVDLALPMALIINELVTNVIKHAYTSDHNKRLIDIRISKRSPQLVQLTLRDYGTGIDQSIFDDKSKTLGHLLIRALVRQIGGHIEYETNKGTLVTITFTLREFKRI